VQAGEARAGNCAGKNCMHNIAEGKKELTCTALKVSIMVGKRRPHQRWRMGTQLQARGLPAELSPTHEPDASRASGGRGARVCGGGEQVILTNSFRANAIAMHASSAAVLTRSIAPL